MLKIERVFKLHRILGHRRTPIAVPELMERLACSKATVYRLIELLRDRLGAPIHREGDPPGFRYLPLADGRAYELPGLWLSASELQALVIFEQLLTTLEPGLLDDYLAPVAKRLDELLRHKKLKLDQAPRRVRLLSWAARSAGPAFHSVASATLQRHQLRFHYHSRSRDQHSVRQVCPQRIVRYRDNWYLDAWDHDRKALRSFALDRIGQAEELDATARDIPEDELNRHYESAFGIFDGKANKVAVLRFTPERARWVADERWHPAQSGRFEIDGHYVLEVPYRDSRELVMEVLRHGAEVEVVGPEGLRREIAEELRGALRGYGDRQLSEPG